MMMVMVIVMMMVMVMARGTAMVVDDGVDSNFGGDSEIYVASVEASILVSTKWW